MPWPRLASWDLSCLKNLVAWARITCVLPWLWKLLPDMAAQAPPWCMVSYGESGLKELILIG